MTQEEELSRCAVSGLLVVIRKAYLRFLSYATEYIQPCTSPSLPPSLCPSLYPSITPSLPCFVCLSLPPYLALSLPPSLLSVCVTLVHSLPTSSECPGRGTSGTRYRVRDDPPPVCLYVCLSDHLSLCLSCCHTFVCMYSHSVHACPYRKFGNFHVSIFWPIKF